MNFDISKMDFDTALELGFTEQEYIEIMDRYKKPTIEENVKDETNFEKEIKSDKLNNTINRNKVEVKEKTDTLAEIGVLLLELKSGLLATTPEDLSLKGRYKRLRDYYSSIGIDEAGMIDIVRRMKF